MIYNVHPSTKNYTEISDHDNDYNHLIRAVQMHKCLNTYCLRSKGKSKELVCRFKYPKELQHESTI